MIKIINSRENKRTGGGEKSKIEFTLYLNLNLY